MNGSLSSASLVLNANGFRYTDIYHPYYAIVPPNVLETCNLEETVRTELQLFTAMITVAAKDIHDGDVMLRATSGYMQELILDIFAGQKCRIGAVEALLLLAEWEPHSCLSNSSLLGCGDEDNAAWMHIGTAIRLAISLRLDRRPLVKSTQERVEHNDRATLTWTGKL